jgi:CDP-glycerol glycerophosphotransferase (TagB/SpsB family)
MLKVLIIIFNFHLAMVYKLLKLLKTKDRVVFMSRQTDKPSLDFKMLIEELEKDNIDVIILCRRMKKTLKDNISYYFHLYKQMYYLATSKVCIIDAYIPTVSILNHKKELKVIQIWHALGAIKKFGLQSIGNVSGRNKDVSEAAKMHANYDTIISTSKKTTEYFSEAFGYDKKHFSNFGLPRIDYLYKNKDIIKNNILLKYPKIGKKKTILYAPTFRTTMDDKAQELIKAIDLKKYNLIIKEHYIQKLNFERNKVFTCPEFSPLELLTVSDFIITDYSAVAIEAAIIDVKLYFYIFDYEKYKMNNGLNMDMKKDYPNLSFKDEVELLKAIKSKTYPKEEYNRFKDAYLPKELGESTLKIKQLIIKYMRGK